ncbi:hypothetical protein HHI36_005113 [Cryptolaemus montrouzieri]|uniref:Uncharacterized protein n=1 Tax=Cryptolaemus montrouzieri TaxID=559131 RepID=A0ABD2NT77_9CUCU
MSINVTVTGNPISVKQGRMVTASPNHSKKEFERRRLIRLSQVRQQSKNIAEDVRNRVRQQKLKQVEEIQKEGQRKLKQWQARKLLELQNQYHEALKDIGAGHKEAGLLEGEIDTKSEKKENDDKIAMQRASVANKKLQEEKEKLKQRLSVPIQKKKLVRKIEDKRAHIVTELRRSTESFKKKNNEKLSVQTEVSGIVTESDSDYEDIEEGSIPIDTNIRTEVEPSDSSQKNSKKTVPLKVIEEFSEKNAACESEGHSAEKVPFSDYDEQLLQDLRREKDTRISDRIRKRSSHQLDQPDVCDSLSQPCPIHQKNSSQNVYAAPSKKSVTVSEGSQTMFSNIQQNIYTCSCKRNFPSVPNTPCDCTHPTPRIQKPGLSDINRFKCVDFTDDEDNSRSCKFQKNHMQKAEVKQSAFAPPSSSKRIATQETRSQRISKEIPTKPKVTLKSVKSPLKNSGILSDKTIQQLQSKTRQSRFLATHVEKIVEENLVTSPEPETEFDFYEKIRQRDKEALLRGQKALEREKLQREYNELMRKLPALQKLERLYGMNQDKPEYHMTEERLREQERKKQNILDNTYEKLFPDRRPPTVTIPIKNIPLDNIKDKVKVPRSDDSVSLNLGVWEADRKSKKLYTEDEVEAMLCEGKIPSESKFRTDQLKSVLEKLRKQKEELLKEIQNLPNGAEKLSSVKHSKKVKDPISTDSCAEIENPERTDITENSKYILKNSKKYVSVKVGTNSTLQSSSSYETIEEPVEKQSKTAKQVKPTSRAVQVTSQKLKASVKTKKIIKPTSPQKISKKRRSEKEIISSSDQSLSDEKVTKNKLSSKENLKSSVNPPNKKKKPAEVNIAEHSVTPLVPTNTLTSLDVQSKTSKDEAPQNIRQIISCDCNKDSALKKKSELCEIVIKIKDGKSSEVLIKDKKENVNSELKSANVEKFRSNKKVEENELLQKQNELRKALKDDCCQSKNDSKASSWHEKFSRNNSQVSNSSTSYMSPHNFLINLNLNLDLHLIFVNCSVKNLNSIIWIISQKYHPKIKMCMMKSRNY